MSRKNNLTESAQDQRIQDYINILAPLYSGGCDLEDFPKVLLYLQSLTYSEDPDKKEIKNHWIDPYMESLLSFFSKLKEDTETMEENKNYIKY